MDSLLTLATSLDLRLSKVEKDVSDIKSLLSQGKDKEVAQAADQPPPPPPPSPPTQPPPSPTQPPPPPPSPPTQPPPSPTQPPPPPPPPPTQPPSTSQQLLLTFSPHSTEPLSADVQQGENTDQSEADQSEEGFLDLNFNKRAVPLNSIFPGAIPEGEIPQSADESDESDDGQLITRKRKIPSSPSKEADEGEGSSSVPHPKRQKRVNLEQLSREWGMSIEEVRLICSEHNESVDKTKAERRDSLIAKSFASTEGGIEAQASNLQRFNEMVTQRQRVMELNERIDRKKFENVLSRRASPDPIIKVRCTKPKNESLKIHLVRRKAQHEQTEILFARELIKYGYSEWIQIQEIIAKHKGVHAQELKLALDQLITKAQKLSLVPSADSPHPSSSASGPRGKKSKYAKFLLPFGSVYINNKLPVGVHPVQHMFIREPDHGIFYLDDKNQMCFQRTEDIPAAPTEHLFNLRLECMGHGEVELGYHALISLELKNRFSELSAPTYIWMKQEILDEADNFDNV